MQTTQNQKERGKIVSDLFGYTPAVLKEYKPFWCIEYYVVHPATQELTRVREKVTNYKRRYGVKEARKLLRVAVSRLNLKLSQGFNPFFTHEDSRLLERLPAVVDKFLQEKRRDLRKNSMRQYDSVSKELLTWTAQNYPIITASTFSHSIAIRYMDFGRGDRESIYNLFRKHGRKWAWIELPINKRENGKLIKGEIYQAMPA